MSSIKATKTYKMLPKSFNKKKKPISYGITKSPNLSEIQSLGRKQCSGKDTWPEISKINAWMVTAETSSFMKLGGLGMVAAELPEVFNQTFNKNDEKLSIITPLYMGSTGKKKAWIEDDIYHGTEKNSINIQKIKTIVVPFLANFDHLTKHYVDVHIGRFENTDYIFLQNETFFSIDPHPQNSPAQDGCYVLNNFNINEVERFAFFSKAVYILLKDLLEKPSKKISTPNVLLANDWHSGAISGLTKYLTLAQQEANRIDEELATSLKNIPVIHIAHHLGYQGWDYKNTAKILNSLYEDLATTVFKNAKAVKNTNPRTSNTLIVSDCYNQASCGFHLADRVVTVSKNYMEEVSKELDFGLDFRDILKTRKDLRNFFGIINGYDKNLISPNKAKIESINERFAPFKFDFYDEKNLAIKAQNKKEFLKLISKISSDETFCNQIVPTIDTYNFADIAKSVKDITKTPIICATSRLVEQKGYDIAITSILDLANKFDDYKGLEAPIFILGGAGSSEYFKELTAIKDKIDERYPQCGERVFLFRGYSDSFAYIVQLVSDFYMMPSRFEPCGLTQMEAMAKGTIPIAMSTGGLVDTIDDGVDGFRTEAFFSAKNRRVYGTNLAAQTLKNNINAYTQATYNALQTFYNQPQKIAEMRANAMKKDFSWDVENGSIYKYYQLLKTGHI